MSDKRVRVKALVIDIYRSLSSVNDYGSTLLCFLCKLRIYLQKLLRARLFRRHRDIVSIAYVTLRLSIAPVTNISRFSDMIPWKECKLQSHTIGDRPIDRNDFRSMVSDDWPASFQEPRTRRDSARDSAKKLRGRHKSRRIDIESREKETFLLAFAATWPVVFLIVPSVSRARWEDSHPEENRNERSNSSV